MYEKIYDDRQRMGAVNAIIWLYDSYILRSSLTLILSILWEVNDKHYNP